METKVKIIERVGQGEKVMHTNSSRHEELTNEDLVWLEGQRKNKDKRKEKQLKDCRDSWCRKRQGGVFIWRGTGSFWTTGPEWRPVREVCSSSSECSLLLPCHLCREKKSQVMPPTNKKKKKLKKRKKEKTYIYKKKRRVSSLIWLDHFFQEYSTTNTFF